MAGYTNSFTAINGDLITAPLFDNEYGNLETAFDAAAGHKHDGSAGEGGWIPMIADSVDLNEVLCNDISDTIDFAVNVGAVKTTQLSIADGAILPTVTNDIDLGGVGAEFKDIYSEGTANLTIIEATGVASLDGGIDVDNTGSVFSVDGVTGAILTSSTIGVTGVANLDGGINVDEAGSVFSVNGVTGNTIISGTLDAGASTLADLTLTTGVTVSAILDEDDMVSDSATAVPTQQSTKAYVDNATLDGGSF